MHTTQTVLFFFYDVRIETLYLCRKIHCLRSELHVKLHMKYRYHTNRQAKGKLNYETKPNVLNFCEP